MSAASLNLAAFRAQLQTAIAEGRIGRQQLVDTVKAMPIEQMAALPPAAIEMLGPTGLAEIAKSRIATDAELRDLQLKPQKPIVEEVEKNTKRVLPRSLARALLIGVIILVVGFVADLARPLVAITLDHGVRPILTETWPICRRLDPYTDGCLYKTRSGRLSLERAAAFLRMPAAELAAVNKHFAFPPTAPLPADSTIIVWRGAMTLEGTAR